MRTVSFIARTSLALTAAAFAAGSADAAIVVFDTFGAGAQSVTAAGSLAVSGTATGTSGANASIGAVAGSRNQRTARASWDTAQNVSILNAEKTARSASTVIDTSAGVARMSFGGRVSNATCSVAYLAGVGQAMDLSSYDGVQLAGVMTAASGFSQSSIVTLDVVLVDAMGVSGNYYFNAADASGGLTALNGLLSANFVDFAAFNPLDPFSTAALDLTQIASVAVNFSYYDGSFGAPSVSGIYHLGQIGLISTVPAPGAIAVLAAAGLIGASRRRT